MKFLFHQRWICSLSVYIRPRCRQDTSLVPIAVSALAHPWRPGWGADDRHGGTRPIGYRRSRGERHVTSGQGAAAADARTDLRA